MYVVYLLTIPCDTYQGIGLITVGDEPYDYSLQDIIPLKGSESVWIVPGTIDPNED